MMRRCDMTSGIHRRDLSQYPLSPARASEILQTIARLRILLIGDACLDVYWHADMTLSELSRETPHYPLPVVDERFSPGGCANAAACLASLGVSSSGLLTVIGSDWRGRELLRGCNDHGIDTSAVIQTSLRVTPAYCKPIRKGISDVAYEDPRIDFDNRTPLPESVEAELIEGLRQAAETVDAIGVSDQLECGVITPAIRDVLSTLSRDGMPVVVDSRSRIALFGDVVTKPNEYECLAALRSIPCQPETQGAAEPELPRAAAIALSKQTRGPVCMTLGARGAIWATGDASTHIPGIPVDPPVDTVGAGDCFLSALTAALAAGCAGPEAASIANLASAVTVKKLHTTGTATPDEIMSLCNRLTGDGVWPND